MNLSHIVGDLVLFSIDDKLKENILKALGESPILPTTTKTTIKFPAHKSKKKSTTAIDSMEFTKVNVPLFTKLKTHTFAATKDFKDICIGREIFHRKSYHTKLCDTLLMMSQEQQKSGATFSYNTPRMQLKFIKESVMNNIPTESVVTSHSIHFEPPVILATRHRNLDGDVVDIQLNKSVSPTNTPRKNSYNEEFDKKVKMSSHSVARRNRSNSTSSRVSPYTSVSLPNFDKTNLVTAPPDTKNTPPLLEKKEIIKPSSPNIQNSDSVKCENITLATILNGIHINDNIPQHSESMSPSSIDYNMSISENDMAATLLRSHSTNKNMNRKASTKSLMNHKPPKIAGYLSFNFLIKKYLHFLESNNDVYFWEYVSSLLDVGLSLDDAMNYCHCYNLSDFKELGRKVLLKDQKSLSLNISTSIYDINSVNHVHLNIHVLNHKNSNFTKYILDFKARRPHEWLSNDSSTLYTSTSPRYMNHADSDQEEDYDIIGDDGKIITDRDDDYDDCEDLKLPYHDPSYGSASGTDEDSSVGDMLHEPTTFSIELDKYFSNEINKSRPKKPMCYVLCIDLHNIKTFSIIKDYMEMMSFWIACDTVPPEILSYIIRVREKLKHRRQTKQPVEELEMLNDSILSQIKDVFFKQNRAFVVVLGHSFQSFANHQISKKISDLRGESHMEKKSVSEPTKKNPDVVDDIQITTESIEKVEMMEINLGTPREENEKPDLKSVKTTSPSLTKSHTSTTSSGDDGGGIKNNVSDDISNNPLHHGYLEGHIQQTLELSKRVFGTGHFAFMNIDCSQPIQVNMTFQKIASILVRQFGVVSHRDGYSSSSPFQMYGKKDPSDDLLAILQHIYLNSY